MLQQDVEGENVPLGCVLDDKSKKTENSRGWSGTESLPSAGAPSRRKGAGELGLSGHRIWEVKDVTEGRDVSESRALGSNPKQVISISLSFIGFFIC